MKKIMNKNELLEFCKDLKDINSFKKIDLFNDNNETYDIDLWIKMNDNFNSFVNHKKKKFKKIIDNYMIL